MLPLKEAEGLAQIGLRFSTTSDVSPETARKIGVLFGRLMIR